MSDEPVKADEAEVDAQGAVTKEAPPWGDDFDPERAWSSIQAGRTTEKELKERLRTAESVWDDEEALRARLIERGFEFSEDEEPDIEEDDDDEPEFQLPKEVADQLSKHEEFVQRQQANEAKKAFDEDLDKLIEDAEFELENDERELILDRSIKGGFNPDATKKAFEDYVALVRRRETQAVEKLKGSKRAPHVATGGKASSGPQPDMDTQAGREEFYKHRMANG